MGYFIALIFASFLSFIDGSVSSIVANVFILLVCFLYSLRFPKRTRTDVNKYISIVYVLYIGFAYIMSLSFVGGQEFYVSDSADYISKFINSNSYNPDYEALFLFYSQLEGKDTLYKELLRCACGFANTNLGGATVYFMTLIQSLFGILSAIVLYQIILKQYNKGAFNSALLFSCCSLFLMYSCLIIRDIIIAYFYLEAIRILFDKYKIKNVFILLVLCVLTMGIRRLSGVFLFSFLLLYFFLYTRRKKNNIILFFFAILAIFILATFVSTVFFEDSMSEIELRSEHTNERIAESRGLINSLLGLPIGIRQLAILLFSQMAPFPSYGTLLKAESFSQNIMGLDVMIFEFFWFFVFYTLIIFIVFKRSFSIYNKVEKYLFIIAIIFIIALTAHPDIRRMMPVYPIIYLLYLKIKQQKSKKEISKVRSLLFASYIMLFVVYITVKGF